MKTRFSGLVFALLLSAGACKRRDEATVAPTPTPITTTAPAPAPVAVVDAGPTVPGPNAMAQPGTVPDAGGLAPGSVLPTGAPPAAPIAAAPTTPAAPATAPTAPTAPHAPTTAANNHRTQIQIPGMTNQPPINIDQSHGQTRVNVGGVQVLIPGMNR